MTIDDSLYSSSSSSFSSSSRCFSYYSSDYSQSSSAATSHDAVPLALFQQLEKEVGNKIHLNVDIAKFTHEVWGLEEDSIAKLLSMSVALDDTEKETFKECSDDDELHKKFTSICDKLLASAAQELGDDFNDSFKDTFWDRLRPNLADASRQRFPDMINTSKAPPSDGSAPSLASAKAVVEVKRPSQEKQESGDNEDEDHGEEGQRGQTSAHGERPQGDRSKGSGSSLKRSFDSVGDDAEKDGGPVKKQRREEEDFPLRNSLLPLYATDTLASNSRYYVVGLLVDRFTVTVCYFDRFLVTCVASFSFDQEPSKLALVLYAMAQCDSRRAGLDPHLRPSCSHTVAVDSKLENEGLPCTPVEDVIGSYFEYPTDSSPKGEQPPNFSSSSSECLQVSGVLRRPDELIGRATTVYKVRRRIPDGGFSEEEYAFKLSWPPKSRLSEIETVKKLKETLPKAAHDHLPDFLFTFTSTAEDLKLPWLRLGLSLTDANHEERELRGMVGKLYHKPWEVGTIEHFKQAWIDCVEVLYLTRKMGKVLHRDLSEGNIMVLKLPGDTVKGVLNDWDMAKFVDTDSDSLSDSKGGTGTLPFMAIDLVQPDRTEHWFRHDLESLFWILLWAALHYNLLEGTRDTATHPSVLELTTSVKQCWQRKTNILSPSKIGIRDVHAGIKPEFAGLLKEWIEPLRFLFVKGQTRFYAPDDKDEKPNEATYNGVLTFKNFMAAIGVTPRTWGIADYLDDDDF